MGEHSKLLSPSASGIWMVCTAMPQALADSGIGSTDSPASLLGTYKHDLAEDMYIGAIDENDRPDDMDVHDWQEVLTGVECANRFLSDMEETFTEVRVGFEDWRKDCFGTSDLAGFNLESRVVKIGDYKFGRVRVEVERNSQMMIYGRAFLNYIEKHFDVNPVTAFDTIEFAIIQPKVSREEITWSISMKDLLDWDDDVLAPAMKEVLGGNGKFVTGRHCGEKYCNLSMAGLCPVALDLVDDLANDMILADQKPEFGVNSELMYRLMENEKLIKRTIEAAWGMATTKAMNGEVVEGYKLVKGKGKRVWKDEKEAAKYLKGKLKQTDIYTQSMITGPQAETKLKQAGKLTHSRSKNLFEEQIEWKAGGTILTKESDPREAIEPPAPTELEEFYENEESDVPDIDDLMNEFL